MLKKVTLRICFALIVIAFSCCSEDKEMQQQNPLGGEQTETDEELGSTDVVMKNGSTLDMGLTEQSKITFTKEYLVIKKNGKETKCLLSDISRIVYKEQK